MPGAVLEVDGVPTRSATELVVESEKPTKVTFGTASFYVMRRARASTCACATVRPPVARTLRASITFH